MSLPISLEGKQGIIGGDLNSYGTKINNIQQELADGINELYDDILEINGVSSGLATKLDKDGYIGTAQDLKDNIDLKEDKSNKGVANGYVPLNGSTLIDAQYLPSYVDDIIEGYYDSGIFYEDSGHTTPIVGTQGKVYVDITSGKANQYRWSGSAYVFLGTGNLATTTTDGLMSADDKVQVGKYRVYNTVAEMQSDNANITEGMTIQLLGYYTKNDGAGHFRKIENSDDGSGIALGNGLFANYIAQNGIYNIKHFGAKGDYNNSLGTGQDETTIIQNTIDFVNSVGGGKVFFDEGNYKTTNTIDVKDNVETYGFLNCEIHKLDDTNQAWYVRTNSSIFGIKFKSYATVRGPAFKNACIVIGDSYYSKVKYNIIEGSKAGGIVSVRSEYYEIEGNLIKNTLADGIHNTDKSKNGYVTKNKLENTGDDGISVVSYQTDLGYVENIVIEKNIVINSKARGITHIGGKNVKILKNKIDGTASSGILVHKDGSYNTYEPNDTTVEKNYITNNGAVSPLIGNQFGIEVTDLAVRTKISKNTVFNTSLLYRSVNIGGIDTIFTENSVTGGLNSQFNNCNNLKVSLNKFELAGTYGAYFTNVSDSLIFGNTYYNNNVNNQAGIDNVHFTNCSYCYIKDEITKDDRVPNQLDRALECTSSCSNLKVKNIINKTTKIILVNGTSNIEIDTVFSNSVPTSNIYVAGQFWFNTTTKILYMYNGSAWMSIPTT